MNRRTCASRRANFITLRSRSLTCCSTALRASSSGLIAAISSGRPSINSSARTAKTLNLARPMTRPRFLRRPRTWFSRSRLILTSSARLASSALTEWLSISWTSKPAGSINSAGTSSQPPAPGQQPGLQKCLASPGPASPAACSLIFAPNRVCRSRTARLPHRAVRKCRFHAPFVAQCLQQARPWCRYSLRPFGRPLPWHDAGALSRVRPIAVQPTDRETPRRSHRGGHPLRNRNSSFVLDVPRSSSTPSTS